jgi:acetyl esterase
VDRQRRSEQGPGSARLAVAGDSVGGNMTAALTLMAKERGDVPLVQQVLFYPVTDASFDTASYHQFAEGPAPPSPAGRPRQKTPP